MKNKCYIFPVRRAFSLAEALVAVIIGAMVLISVLTIYSRAETSAAAIDQKLGSNRMPYDVLQRIAEDVDKIITAGAETAITVENKLDNGLATARLTILKTYYDKQNKKEPFEQIVWQSDYVAGTGSLVLYRSHSGLAMEDKLLDSKKEDWEREMFVPFCDGVTFFKVQVRKGQDILDRWTAGALPDGIVVTVSFARPFKTISGTLDVPDSEKITRTIAIDRTRKLRFVIVPNEKSDEQSVLQPQPGQTEQSGYRLETGYNR